MQMNGIIYISEIKEDRGNIFYWKSGLK